MRELVAVVALTLVLAGCGGAEATDQPAPGEPVTVTQTVEATPAETTPQTIEAAQSEPDQCLVAASKWADRVADHVLDLVTTAPAFGDTVNLRNLEDSLSTIKVLCSEDIQLPVREAMVKITEANYEVSVCALFGGACTGSQAKRIRRIANQAASLVGEMRNQL